MNIHQLIGSFLLAEITISIRIIAKIAQAIAIRVPQVEIINLVAVPIYEKSSLY